MKNSITTDCILKLKPTKTSLHSKVACIEQSVDHANSLPIHSLIEGVSNNLYHEAITKGIL